MLFWGYLLLLSGVGVDGWEGGYHFSQSRLGCEGGLGLNCMPNRRKSAQIKSKQQWLFFFFLLSLSSFSVPQPMHCHLVL